MNYLDAINRFWMLRRGKKITNVQADLYYFLLQESNQRNWENPFYCANGLVCSGIGVTEKTLIDARNVLKQLGIIDFKSGVTKQKAPCYYLLEYWNKVSNRVSNEVGIDGSNEVGIEANILLNKTSKSGTNVPAHWKKIVEQWFDFYTQKFSPDGIDQVKPIFNATQGAHLKKILRLLEGMAKDKKKDWTEDYASRTFNHFLSLAWGHDDWMRQNFELANMLTKFNSITNSKNGKSAEVKPGTSTARTERAKNWGIDNIIRSMPTKADDEGRAQGS